MRQHDPQNMESPSEAHLPAQQPSAAQEARVPPAHAYARRPVDPVFSPPQGPRQTGSLTRIVVLPASARMTRSRDFDVTVRRGRRARGGRVVAHLSQDTAHSDAQDDSQVRVGFIVSKAVGNSVTRHRVARQLRHILAGHLDQLAPGSRLVIRALPGCAESTSEAIDRDVTRALRRLLEGNRPAGLPA
jgi:ribonuclease P protein component